MYQIRTFNGEEDIHAELASTIHTRATAERFAKQYGRFVFVYRHETNMRHPSGYEWVLHYTINPMGQLC